MPLAEIRRAATFVFHPLNCGNQVTHDLSYIESDAYLFSGTYTVTNRMLGAGGFGVVLLAREERTQRQIACKVVNLRSKKLKRGNIKEMLMKEVQILMGLSHPNIINIHKVYSTPDRIYIFEDLITGGDLWSHIERKGQIEEIEAIPILWQLIEALGFLHEHGIAHRDLKPDNILLTSSEHGARIVLADFGAAKQAPPGTRMLTFVGTVEYTAPFGLPIYNVQVPGNPAASGYDHSVDLWSVGVILYMMLAGQQPFALNGTGPTENKNVHDRALRCDLSSLEADPIWAEVSDYAKDLIRNLIVVDADGRLDVSVIRRHPWFSRYTDDLVPLYYRAI
ncbi:kinase-like domain-containing protein, partial [Kalaharituber pfeilii]